MENNTPGNVIQPTPGGRPDNEPQDTQPVQPPVTQPPTPAPVEPASPVTQAAPAPVATPVTDTTPAAAAAPAPASPVPQPATPRKNKKFFVFAAVAAFVLLGGGASAYFGYILPNKPENRMARAFANMVEQKQFKAAGTVDYTPNETGGPGVSVSYAADVNTEKNQFGLSGTVGVNGSQFPYDVRYVDKNIYLKVGGLNAIGDMLAGIGSSAAGDMYANVFRDVNDQWFVVDRSFWQSMGSEANCVTDLTFVFNDQDVDMVKSAYSKHPLFHIENAAADTVDGTAVTRFELKPADGATAKSFAGELEELSIVKNVRDCLEKAGIDEEALDEELAAPLGGSDSETAEGTLSVYLDGSNRIRKIELTVNDESGTTKISQTLTYENVSVSAPEGAKPVQELLGSILGGFSFVGGSEFLPGGNGSTRGRDIDRKNELKLLQVKLETYFNDNGAYPKTGELISVLELSPDDYQDPDGQPYEYVSDGQTYTLSTTLENPNDPDLTNGRYVIRDINSF